MSSFQDAIDINKKAKPSAAKKSTMPVIDISETDLVPSSLLAEVEKAIKEFPVFQKEEKEAKAEKEYAAEVIVDLVRRHQDKEAFSGDFSKSYEVKGSENSVKYITADKFSVKDADKEKLKKLFKKSYDELFEEKLEVSLKAEVLNSEDLQEELMNLVGKENFSKFFDVETTFKTKVGFDENLYKNVSADKVDEVRTLVKQNKPSIR